MSPASCRTEEYTGNYVAVEASFAADMCSGRGTEVSSGKKSLWKVGTATGYSENQHNKTKREENYLQKNSKRQEEKKKVCPFDAKGNRQKGE